MSNLRELYQEVIIDHNKSPRNFRVMPEATCHAEGFNPLCGDKITLYLSINADNIITDTSFVGTGCAISTASASLLTEQLKGKSIQDANALFQEFHGLLTDESNKDSPRLLGKLTVLLGVREFPARVKCATLAWHTLQAALTHQEKPVSTE
jgi:nitrogen fixation protein NifU and related proteins